MWTLARVGQAFWLALPVTLAGVVHMAVVRLDLLPTLRAPLDGGRTWGKHRVLGDHKTWRGLFVMVAAPAALGLAQGLLAGGWAARHGLECLDMEALGRRLGATGAGAGVGLAYLALNGVLGLGYALGELPNSLVKRRLGVEPGRRGSGVAGTALFLVDQADSVVAALGLAWLCVGLPWEVALVGVVCLTGLHLAMNVGLYAAGLRREL
ncbi:MAG: CDP-archaeol synthase [Planctomycetes bacterium]|nr:CDP-archaeol synthase [Planctomycetota bacterium]